MENETPKNKIEKSREIENSEAKISVPDDAIFFGGKTNKELTIETTDKNSAKFAIFNINGNEAEYAYVGKAINENWFEGVAQITNSVNDNLNNFNYVKTIETGKVKKENDEWVVTTMAKIKFINENIINQSEATNNMRKETLPKENASDKQEAKSEGKVQEENAGVNAEKDKQEKIDAIVLEIMKIIDRNKKAELREKELEEELAKLMSSNEKEPRIYSADYIKSKFLSLIKEVKKIKEVKNLDIKIEEKEIKINTTVTSSGFDIKVQLVLENKRDNLAVKNYNIDAKWPAKGEAEKALAPHLSKLADTLKSYIEKEENIKVEKVWIEDGELKVL